MGNIKFSSEGKITFYLSFVIGTMLFIGFILSKSNVLVILGFYYVLIAAVVNFIIFFIELITFLSDVGGNKSHGNSALLLLFNIPVTVVYLILLVGI